MSHWDLSPEESVTASCQGTNLTELYITPAPPDTHASLMKRIFSKCRTWLSEPASRGSLVITTGLLLMLLLTLSGRHGSSATLPSTERQKERIMPLPWSPKDSQSWSETWRRLGKP